MKNQFLKYGIFKNKYLIYAIIFGIFLQVVVAIAPPLAKIFDIVPLNKVQWIFTSLISISPLIIIELQKKINTHKEEYRYVRKFSNN